MYRAYAVHKVLWPVSLPVGIWFLPCSTSVLPWSYSASFFDQSLIFVLIMCAMESCSSLAAVFVISHLFEKEQVLDVAGEVGNLGN